MILGNLIVFLVVIVIVCAVDLSSFSLDESTEKLLYYDADEATDSTEVSAEDTDTGNSAETKKETMTGDSVGEEVKVENVEENTNNKGLDANAAEMIDELENLIFSDEIDELKSNGREDMASEISHGDRTVEENGAVEKNAKAANKESVKAAKRHSRILGRKEEAASGHPPQKIVSSVNTGNEIPVSSLDDSLGLHADFDDDFMDISNLIREVHEGGSPS